MQSGDSVSTLSDLQSALQKWHEYKKKGNRYFLKSLTPPVHSEMKEITKSLQTKIAKKFEELNEETSKFIFSELKDFTKQVENFTNKTCNSFEETH